MVPTGCWIGAGLGPEADQLEGGSTAVLAGMRPCDTVRSQMAIVSENAFLNVSYQEL